MSGETPRKIGRGYARNLDAGPFQSMIGSFDLHLRAGHKSPKTITIYTDAATWLASASLVPAGLTDWSQVPARHVQPGPRPETEARPAAPAAPRSPRPAPRSARPARPAGPAAARSQHAARHHRCRERRHLRHPPNFTTAPPSPQISIHRTTPAETSHRRRERACPTYLVTDPETR